MNTSNAQTIATRNLIHGLITLTDCTLQANLQAVADLLYVVQTNTHSYLVVMKNDDDDDNPFYITKFEAYECSGAIVDEFDVLQNAVSRVDWMAKQEPPIACRVLSIPKFSGSWTESMIEHLCDVGATPEEVVLAMFSICESWGEPCKPYAPKAIAREFCAGKYLDKAMEIINKWSK